MTVSSTFQRPAFDPRSAPASTANIKTVAQLVDFNARHNPEHLFCYQQEGAAEASGDDTLIPVTFRQFELGVLKCQDWLRDHVQEMQLPGPGPDGTKTRGKPVALMMDSDVGLLFHLFALIGLGVPVLLLSARLSPLAVQGLVRQTGANAIIATARQEGTVKEANSLMEEGETRPGTYIPLKYDKYLNDSSLKTPSRTRNWSDDHYISDTDRQVLILHSSGTTGLPKAIPQSHRYMLNYATCYGFQDRNEAESVNVTTLPLFHGFGLLAPYFALSIGKTFAIPNPRTLPTGRSTAQLLRRSNAGCLMSVPSIIEEISDLPDGWGMETLKSLQFIASGGGALKPSYGEAFQAAGVKIVNSFGTTETGPLSVMHVPGPGHDWRYFRLRDDMEIRIVEDAGAGGRQRLVVHPPGWQVEFETQDHLTANPDNPTREFRPAERVDDVLVLANGEKVAPQILENLLCERDDVRAALAFGSGQFQLGVFVESSRRLTPGSTEEADFKAAIWPTILEAGTKMDEHARISGREAIVVLGPDALPRSDKRAIIRRESYQKFAQEIAECYQRLDDSAAAGVSMDLWEGDLEQNVKQLIENHVGWRTSAQPLTVSQDLFDLGMDSLQATQLRRLLSSLVKSSAKTAKRELPRDLVYQCPSISKLASWLRGGEQNGSVSETRDGSIQQYVDKYSLHPDPTPPAESGAVVLLTGATGGLGAHLLAQLCSNRSVSRVICLNRPSEQDPRRRQLERSKTKGASLDESELSKVEVYGTRTALPKLGLSDSTYRGLAATVTHIVHNAWPMDFMRRLPSFDSQFVVLSNLLDFARDIRSAQPAILPRFLFVSSISVVGNHHKTGDAASMVPEQPLRDTNGALDLGYAEAKLVCERILQRAAEAKEADVVIARMGQITGATTNGLWNPEEHFPALLKSSLRVGAVPSLAGTASWLPVDTAAAALGEILLTPLPTRLVYHVESPLRQSWRDLMELLARDLPPASAAAASKTPLEVVPFERWLDRVQNIPDPETATANPAKALLEFFAGDFRHMAQGEVVLDTAAARGVSPSLAKVGPVDEELVAKYIASWRAVGYL